MHKAISLAVTLAVAALLIIGCSGGPTVPLDDGASITPEPEGGSQRFLLGVFEIDIDAAASQLTIEPVRNASAHYDVTDYITPPQCDDCLEIEVLEFKPIDHYVKLKISIRNPTHFTVYDVRGIMISNFEGMHLLNADSYTDLWDDGGDVTINPFRAFATDWPHREILPDTGHARIYEIEYPTFGDLLNILLVFDASWPGNCEEPYEITNFTQEPIYDFTGSAGNIYVDVHDWQNDVNKVTLVAPEIAGEDFTQLYHLGGDTWSFELANSTGTGAGDYYVRLIATSSNSLDLPLYDFNTITITESLNPDITGIDPDYATQAHDLTGVTVSGIGFVGPGAQVKLKMDGKPDIVADNVTVIDESTITCDISITPEAAPGLYDVEVTNGSGLSDVGTGLFEVIEATQFNVVDVTPRWLNFSAYDVCVDGDYAYVAGRTSGLIIFDISNPSNPVWVNRIDTPGSFRDVTVAGAYAYVADKDAGLQIIDITTPESANIVKTVYTPGHAFGVAVSGGYAYVADHIKGLQIIDITSPESAYIVKTVDTPVNALCVAVSSGYAYVGEGSSGLQIIDIEPIDSANIVNAVDAQARGVAISGGYAYVAAVNEGLQIIDIDPPESAFIAKTVDTPGYARGGVIISGSYAYVADGPKGLQIIDITSPESAFIVKTVDTPGDAYGVAVSSGYAYMADQRNVQVIDVEPIESAYIVKTVDNLRGANSVAVSGGYAYVGNYYAGLQILDITSPDNAFVVKVVDTPGNTYGVTVSGGYAYLADAYSGLQIIDITSPESAYIVKTVDTPGNVGDVAVSAGYAYVAASYSGLQIIDIDPIDSAYIVKTIDTPGGACAVAVSGSYAYVTEYYNACLKIIDITSPESAYIVKTVDTPGNAVGVAVLGGYAYVGDYDKGLQIIDIDPPDSAYIFITVDTPGDACGVVVSGGYAYVADYWAGFQIIDIVPPGWAYIIKTVDTPGDHTGNIAISDGYAYVTDAGLWIFQLW